VLSCGPGNDRWQRNWGLPLRSSRAPCCSLHRRSETPERYRDSVAPFCPPLKHIASCQATNSAKRPSDINPSWVAIGVPSFPSPFRGASQARRSIRAAMTSQRLPLFPRSDQSPLHRKNPSATTSPPACPARPSACSGQLLLPFAKRPGNPQCRLVLDT
jgi:hypothetical protein